MGEGSQHFSAFHITHRVVNELCDAESLFVLQVTGKLESALERYSESTDL